MNPGANIVPKGNATVTRLDPSLCPDYRPVGRKRDDTEVTMLVVRVERAIV